MPSGKIRNFLLHLRYILGQIAAAFLVAVPAQLILRGKDWYLLHSLGYGIVFLVAFLLLLPLSKCDWRHVTVPVFQRFESSVAFWATLLTGILLGASFLVPLLKENQPVFWFVLVINFFTWAVKKVNSLFFANFREEPSSGVDAHAPTVLDQSDTSIRRRD